MGVSIIFRKPILQKKNRKILLLQVVYTIRLPFAQLTKSNSRMISQPFLFHKGFIFVDPVFVSVYLHVSKFFPYCMRRITISHHKKLYVILLVLLHESLDLIFVFLFHHINTSIAILLYLATSFS